MAEEIEEWGREGRNTRYGILEKLGGRGQDTHHGEAFKTTGFALSIIIRSDGNTATHTFIPYMGQSNIIGPMSDWAELGFITSTFVLGVVHCLDWILRAPVALWQSSVHDDSSETGQTLEAIRK